MTRSHSRTPRRVPAEVRPSGSSAPFPGAALPEGPVHICFSGGRTSGYMLRKLLDVHGGTLPPDWKVVFANTGKEFDETLDFVQECGERWNVPITWVEYWIDPDKEGGAANSFRVVNHNSASRKGEPFEALIRKRKYLPNVVSRFCTVELKIRVAKKYLQSIGWTHWHNALGIRADEARRVKNDGKDVWINYYPLVTAGVSVREIHDFWKQQEFDLRLETRDGKTWMGNCDGCFLKSEAACGELIRRFPDRAKWWEKMEALVDEIGGGKGLAQFNKRFSRRDLRKFIERQGELAFADLGEDSVLCQKDDGECTG